MDGPRDYHTKWNEPERERQIPHDTIYMWNLKSDMWTYLQKQTHTENKLKFIKGETVWEKDKLGVWN